MDFLYGKIFRQIKSKPVKISLIEYDPKIPNAYYDCIKTQKNIGNIQLVINSKLMLHILKEYVYNQGFKITSILMAEEDEEFMEKCDCLINSSNKNVEEYYRLDKFLSEFIDDNCIELFKIGIKKSSSECGNIFIEIQSNGIVKINTNKYIKEKEYLLILISRYING